MKPTVSRSLGAGRSPLPKTLAGTMVGAAMAAAPSPFTKSRRLIRPFFDMDVDSFVINKFAPGAVASENPCLPTRLFDLRSGPRDLWHWDLIRVKRREQAVRRSPRADRFVTELAGWVRRSV